MFSIRKMNWRKIVIILLFTFWINILSYVYGGFCLSTLEITCVIKQGFPFVYRYEESHLIFNQDFYNYHNYWNLIPNFLFWFVICGTIISILKSLGQRKVSATKK